MDGIFWLINSKTEEKWDQLQGDELDQKLSSIVETDISHFFYWKDGMGDWESVSTNPELVSHYKELRLKVKPAGPPPFKKSTSPPIFKAEQSNEKDHSEKSSPEIPMAIPDSISETFQIIETVPVHDEKVVSIKSSEKLKSAEERRKHKRFSKHFKVLIESKNIIFRTFTHDISVGGISITQGLPEKMLHDECVLYITYTDNKDTLMLKAKPIIRDKGDYKYFSFTEMNEHYKSKLADWLSEKPRKKIA